MNTFLPLFLANHGGHGWIMLLILLMALLSWVLLIVALMQIVYMVKSFKPERQEAQRKVRTLAKINLVGAIGFFIAFFSSQGFEFLFNGCALLALATLGFSLIKTPSNEPAVWTKKHTFSIVAVVAFVVGIAYYSFIEPKNINNIQINPNNKTFITCNEDGALQIWDLATGKKLAKLNNNDFPQELVFSHDGKMLAYSRDGIAKTKLWDLQKKKVMTTLNGSPCGFSHDNKKIVTEDKKVYIWEIATVKLIKTIEKDVDDPVLFNKKFFCILHKQEDNKISLWEIASGKLIKEISPAANYNNLTLSPLGSFFAYQKYNKAKYTMEIYNIKDGTTKTFKEAPLLRFSQDEKRILNSDNEMIDIASGKTLWKISKEPSDDLKSSSPVLHSDGKTFAKASYTKKDGWHIKIWQEGKLLHTFKAKDHSFNSQTQYKIFQFNNDKKKILLSVQYAYGKFHHSAVHVWDVDSGKKLYTLKKIFD